MAWQSSPERGLTEHHAGNAERIPGGLIRISGPLRDRRKRPGAYQYRAQRQAQRSLPVGDAHLGARGSGHRGQYRQQPPAHLVQAPSGGDQLANRRVIGDDDAAA